MSLSRRKTSAFAAGMLWAAQCGITALAWAFLFTSLRKYFSIFSMPVFLGIFFVLEIVRRVISAGWSTSKGRLALIAWSVAGFLASYTVVAGGVAGIYLAMFFFIVAPVFLWVSIPSKTTLGNSDDLQNG